MPTRSLFSKSKPGRVLVGTDYYYASGVVNSLTQLKRLVKAGKLRPFLKNGARLSQFKDVADEDISQIIAELSDAA